MKHCRESMKQCGYHSRPANLSSPKTFRLGCQVGVNPKESLASHTHHMKVNNVNLETNLVSLTFTCQLEISFTRTITTAFEEMK